MLAMLNGLVIIIFGGIFLFFGIIHFLSIVDYSVKYSTNPLIILVIGILGFIWEITHNITIYLLTFSIVFQSFINRTTIFINKKFQKGDILSKSNKQYFSFSSLNKTKFSWKENKEKVMLIMTIIFIPMILKSFETIFYLNMTESLEVNFFSEHHYFWNFMGLYGMRTIAENVRFFPILNIMPGHGLGFIENSLNTEFELIFHNQHPNIDFSEIVNISRETTFSLRLFNLYLPIAISMFISIYVYANYVIRKKIKK